MSQQWKPEEGKRKFSLRNIARILLYFVLPLLLATGFVTIVTMYPLWHGTRSQKIEMTQNAKDTQNTKNKQKSQIIKSPFVSSVDTTLLVDGEPLRLIGYNWNWMGMGCSTPTDAKIDAIFSQVKRVSHGNVIRTAFYQSASDNGTYTHFDRYVKHAKRYGLYIVPMLVNQWDSCEPAKTVRRSQWYQWGYKQPNDGYPLSFRTYALRLATHYAYEPTIAFWQLVNEPDASPCGSAAAQTLRDFADDMTQALKEVDPNHMVDLGAPGQCAGNIPEDYLQIVSGRVGLCDIWHDYDQTATSLPSQMEKRLDVCRSLNKPSFVGEAGICAGIDSSQTCTDTIVPASLQLRAQFFAAKLQAGFNAGLAGYIIWNKGSRSVQSDIGPGDPAEKVLAQYASP
jgi:mannan endo-1,4-beta-mannosidase